MKKRITILICLILCTTLLSYKALAQSDFSDLKNHDFYFLQDFDTGEILLEKNADVRLAPSSMTKIMTAYVVIDQVKQGKLSLDSKCLIGKDAFRKSGSTMFLNYGDIVSIDRLLKGLLAVSGNDASIALAESTAGGVDKFVALMNFKARELGLKNSQFKNPHGLNQDGHYMSLRDLGTLLSHFYHDFPEFEPYLSIREFTYADITQRTHNPLLTAHYDGIVGGKTGYTNDGKYGVVGSVKRDNRRLIAVINKAQTPSKRTKLITELFDFGFERYKKLTLFAKNQPVTKIDMWMGQDGLIEVAPNQEISFNVPRDKSLESIKVEVLYDGPIYAPIAKGSKIATLRVEIPNYKTLKYSLFATKNVGKSRLLDKISQKFSYKIKSFINRFFG